MKQKLKRSGYAANKDRKNLVAAWNWEMEYMNPNLSRLGYVLADIQSVLRHESATTTAKYIKSLGLEGVRSALEALSQQKGSVLIFKPRAVAEGENPSQKEKAV